MGDEDEVRGFTSDPADGNYSELHSYTPFVIHDGKPVGELKTLIEESELCAGSFFASSSDSLDAIADDIRVQFLEGAACARVEPDRFPPAESYGMEVGEREGHLVIGLSSLTAERMRMIADCMSDEEAEFKKLYSGAACCHSRILLAPTECILSNGRQVTAVNQLLLLANGICILKQEMPLPQYGNCDLAVVSKDDYVKKCWNVIGREVKVSFDGIVECRVAFIKQLMETWGSEGIIHSSLTLNHLLMSVYDHQPERFPIASEELERELLRIIWSPVPEMDEWAEKRLVGELESGYLSVYPGICSFFSKTGGVLSCVDRSTLRRGVLVNEWPCRDYKCLSEFTRMINYSFDLAFIVSVVDRLTDEQLFVLERCNPEGYSEAVQSYRVGRLVCEQLQIGCYGSVTDQINEFKEKMPHYFQVDLVERRRETLEQLILDMMREGEAESRRVVEGFTFFITVLVSLPSLSEGMVVMGSLVSQALHMEISELPLRALGVFIWGLLCVLLGTTRL